MAAVSRSGASSRSAVSRQPLRSADGVGLGGAEDGWAVRRRRGRERPGDHGVLVVLLLGALSRSGCVAWVAVLRRVGGAGHFGGGGAGAGPAVWLGRHDGRNALAQ